MKFGRLLEEEAVPEWRHKYINYKRLKKHLKTYIDPLASPSDAGLTERALTALRRISHMEPKSSESRTD